MAQVISERQALTNSEKPVIGRESNGSEVLPARRHLTFLKALIAAIFILMPLIPFSRTILAGNNDVKLKWTVTGDDDRKGTASYYDIRYFDEPIGIDTVLWWQNAVRLESPPDPVPAGQAGSCLVPNLEIDKHYYFAIKVADEANNWSRIAEMPPVICADVNGDGAFDHFDPLYLLDYLYESGQPPILAGNGDVDNSGELNVADAMFMINWRINSGPPPECDD